MIGFLTVFSADSSTALDLGPQDRGLTTVHVDLLNMGSSFSMASRKAYNIWLARRYNQDADPSKLVRTEYQIRPSPP